MKYLEEEADHLFLFIGVLFFSNVTAGHLIGNRILVVAFLTEYSLIPILFDLLVFEIPVLPVLVSLRTLRNKLICLEFATVGPISSLIVHACNLGLRFPDPRLQRVVPTGSDSTTIAFAPIA